MMAPAEERDKFEFPDMADMIDEHGRFIGYQCRLCGQRRTFAIRYDDPPDGEFKVCRNCDVPDSRRLDQRKKANA